MMTGNVLYADPIKVFGIDWSMSYDEMITVAEDRGYKCDTETYTNAISCVKGEEGTKSENEIYITTDTNNVYFNCNVFNGCKYSAEQIKDLLIKEGIAIFFLPEEVRVGFLADDVTPIYRTYYTADGEDGDYITVFPTFKNFIFKNTPQIVLRKGTLGNKINFN